MAANGNSSASNRGEIVSSIAATEDLSQVQVERVLSAYETAITKILAGGGEIRISSLGTFKTAKRAARTARNPQTGGTVKVKARTVPQFKAGKALKDAVDGKKAGSKAGAKAGATKAGAAKAGAAKAGAAKAGAAKAGAAKAGAAKAGAAKAGAAKAGAAKAGAAKAGAAKAGAAKAGAKKGGAKGGRK